MKNRKKQDNAAAQSAIYVGFVDTLGLFASIIRRVIGQNYVHVVLGFDPELKEAYSIGRRNPAIPLFAGFERENREKILKKYPTARYQICRVACTKVQREALQQEAKTNESAERIICEKRKTLSNADQRTRCDAKRQS